MNINTESLSRVTAWVVVTIAIYATAWFGVVEGVAGASNLLQFFIWVTLVLSFGAYAPGIPTNPNKPLPVRAVPANISWISITGVIVLLVWHGWIITALAMVVAKVNLEVYWEDISRYKRKVDNYKKNVV